jgi:PKD repeat protein
MQPRTDSRDGERCPGDSAWTVSSSMGSSMYRLAIRLRAHHRNRTLGQSLVEFALILPVLLLFFAAALDLGRVFYANITLHNAAREGAFQAAVKPDLYQADQPCDQVTNRVVCRVQNETTGSMIAIAPEDIDMTCSMAGCPHAQGSWVTVEVRGKFRLITPLLSVVFGGQELDLGSSAVAQIEYLPDPKTATPPPAPVAVMTANPLTGPVGMYVDFDSSNSTGDPTGFQWDFDGDGVVDSTDSNPTHQYNTAGSFTVTLTVVNLSGVSITSKTITVTPVGGPSSAPSASAGASASAPPSCVYPPNVIGNNPSTAAVKFQTAGFTNVTIFDTLTTGQKNKIQAQNPDHTQCKALNTPVTLFYRKP